MNRIAFPILAVLCGALLAVSTADAGGCRVVAPVVHQQQAVIVTTHPGESHLQFMNHAEDVKAEAHNKGVHQQETVRGHSVKPYTRKVQRYTKAGKVRMKKQKVGGHTRLPYQRKMDLPKREWFDVRHPHDVGMIENNAESLIHRKPVP